MTAPELCAALKRLRLRQGELAVILGVHRMTVAHWMTGDAKVPRYASAYLGLAERCAQVGVWYLSEVA